MCPSKDILEKNIVSLLLTCQLSMLIRLRLPVAVMVEELNGTEPTLLHESQFQELFTNLLKASVTMTYLLH